MNPLEIITEFYEPGSESFQILVKHGQQVVNKAINVAKSVPHLKPDLNFIREKAEKIELFNRNIQVTLQETV